jgi:hypothetical protein
MNRGARYYFLPTYDKGNFVIKVRAFILLATLFNGATHALFSAGDRSRWLELHAVRGPREYGSRRLAVHK